MRRFGPDPLPLTLGTAIGVGVGVEGIMDLCYAGCAPGEYNMPYPPRGVSKGGRGRTWQEWVNLWSVVGDWVYEYESVRFKLLGGTYWLKKPLSHEETRKILSSKKPPRDVLWTDAVRGTDSLTDVFREIAEEPVKFQGWEWDYVIFNLPEAMKNSFMARFCLGKEILAVVEIPKESKRVADDVLPSRQRKCPETFSGREWEEWMWSVRGGDVVVPRTFFQVKL